jgi:hypothetical protein
MLHRIRSTRSFLKSFLFSSVSNQNSAWYTFLIIFPCISCSDHPSLSSDVPRGKGIKVNEVQIKVKTGYVQHFCIIGGRGCMKKCPSGCQSYVAANGEEWLTWARSQKPRDFTVTRTHNCDLHSECAHCIHLHSETDSEIALP